MGKPEGSPSNEPFDETADRLKGALSRVMLPVRGTFKSLTCVRKVTLADPLRYFMVTVVPLDTRKGFRTIAVELGWETGMGELTVRLAGADMTK